MRCIRLTTYPVKTLQMKGFPCSFKFVPSFLNGVYRPQFFALSLQFAGYHITIFSCYMRSLYTIRISCTFWCTVPRPGIFFYGCGYFLIYFRAFSSHATHTLRFGYFLRRPLRSISCAGRPILRSSSSESRADAVARGNVK